MPSSLILMRRSVRGLASRLVGGLCLVSAAAPALATEWPPRPSTILDRSCSEVPEARICVFNHLGRNLPQLEIIYRGYLAGPESESERGGVVAWLNLNDHAGFFHMKRSEGGTASFGVTLGAPTSELPCVIAGLANPLVRGLPGLYAAREEWPDCPAGTEGQAGDGGWIVVGPPDDQAFLLEGVKDSSGKALSWNLEAAFVSVDGRRWDSKYGRNYRFVFGTEAKF